MSTRPPRAGRVTSRSSHHRCPRDPVGAAPGGPRRDASSSARVPSRLGGSGGHTHVGLHPASPRTSRADGISVMLDGEGGDELFGCSPYLIADRLRGGQLSGALALARRLPEPTSHPSRRELLGTRARARRQGSSAARLSPCGPSRFAAASVCSLPGSRARSARLYVESRDEWAWKRKPVPRWWSYLATSSRRGASRWVHTTSSDNATHLRESKPGIHCSTTSTSSSSSSDSLRSSRSTRSARARSNVRSSRAHFRTRSGCAETNRLRRLAVDAVAAPTGPRRVAARFPDAELWAFVKPRASTRPPQVPAERRGLERRRLVWRLATTESWLRAQADQDFPRASARAIGPIPSPTTHSSSCTSSCRDFLTRAFRSARAIVELRFPTSRRLFGRRSVATLHSITLAPRRTPRAEKPANQRARWLSNTVRSRTAGRLRAHTRNACGVGRTEEERVGRLRSSSARGRRLPNASRACEAPPARDRQP